VSKGPEAFRTISEVAEELNIPQHVLRFWETRFSQIRPVKRGGGRRFYRPEDVALLRGIRHLLYGAGYTIRGVQRILREQGVAHVQRLVAQAPVTALSAPQTGEAPPLPDDAFPDTIAEDDNAIGRHAPADDPDEPAALADDRPDDAPQVPASGAESLSEHASRPVAATQIDAVINRYAPGPLSARRQDGRGPEGRAQESRTQEGKAQESGIWGEHGADRVITPNYQLAGATRERLRTVADELRECRRLLAGALDGQAE
jgi:DNA-binding transcriptional MerR regulator